MSDFDTWISTNPADAEQERYERWFEDNEDQLEGLSTNAIEEQYEDFLAEQYEDQFAYDEDFYHDAEDDGFGDY